MSVDVISWLKSLPKNQPLCQHFPQTSEFPSFSPKQFTLGGFLIVYNVFAGEFAACRKSTVTHCKSSVCLSFCRLTFTFLVFHDNTPPCKRFPFELWPSAVVSGNVQVIPVDTVTTPGPDLHLSFTLKYLAGLTTAIWVMYWCSSTTKNDTNKWL